MAALTERENIKDEQYTEGLHWSSPARGAVLYTDKFPLMAEPGLRTREIWAMHRTQRVPFNEKYTHQKTAMTLVVATIRLRRSSPRSRSVWCTVCSQGYPQPAALSRGQRAANGDNIKNPLLFATTPPKPKLKAWPSTTSPVIPPLRRRTFGFAERTPPDLCGKSCTSRSLNYFGKYKSLNHESP